MRKLTRPATLLLLLIFCASCSTYRTRGVSKSGFLGDYSHLRKGGDNEAQLIYLNPKGKISNYDKIMIDPVVLYMGDNKRMERVPKETVQTLLNYFHAALREQLGKDYEIVDKPGPGVIQFRVAMTDARASKVVLDTVSTVVPVGIAISALERVVLGKTLTVGSVRIEAEARDPMTGMQLAALVDELAGAKVTGRFDKWSKWQDARDALDYWSVHFRTRMKTLREREAAKTASAAKP